jgi:hypothetical protein
VLSNELLTECDRIEVEVLIAIISAGLQELRSDPAHELGLLFICKERMIQLVFFR